MSEPEEFDREQSKANLEKFLAEQEKAKVMTSELTDRLSTNKDLLDIGQYNQLLRAIAVHYPSCDDFLMAAAAAWIDVNRKRLEGRK